MRTFRRSRRTLLSGLSGIACGVAGGVIGVALLAGGASGGARDAGDSFITAAHLPPLLTVAGEHATLRYAILCPPPVGTGASGVPCDAAGDVYIRAGQTGSFRRLPLTRGSDSRDGRYNADVPDDIASSPSGFSYYAVLRDRANGTELTLPAGGAEAPQRSYPLRHPVTVRLEAHAFGTDTRASTRVLDAKWGSAVGEAGLSGGKTSVRIGPSAFDVATDGSVALLDEVNHRVQRWRDGKPVATISVDVPAAVDDMSVGANGSIYVLDGRSSGGSTPLLRTFTPDGHLQDARHIAERTWSQLRIGPTGPVVQQSPSEQWMPAREDGVGFNRAAEARRGRPGRTFADGSELVVLRSGAGEVRIARIVDGAVERSWRIVSQTPLAEVQLADEARDRVVLVVKTYTDMQDEFVVLVLDKNGVVERFNAPSLEWAEAAPLARFRLSGSSLYQLGSSAEGTFVQRYGLEAAR